MMPQPLSSPPSQEGFPVLRDTGLLDPQPEPAFDRLTRLAARVLHAPIAVLTLFEGDGVCIKSRVGPAALLDAPWRCPRADVPCAVTAELDEPLVVGDVREDPRMRDLPLVTTLKVVGYAGATLKRSTGQVVGVLSVADTTRREWTEDEVQVLSDLSASMLTAIEWRIEVSERERAADTLRQNEERFRLMAEASEPVFFTHDLEGCSEYKSPSVRAVLGSTAADEAEVLRRNVAILSAIRDSVVVTDLHGVVTYWNTGAEHLFGWEAGEMLGESLLARLPDEMRAKAVEEQAQALAGRELHGEDWDLRKDGTRIPTDTRVSLIRDETGNPTAILRITRDLSDEKLREAQLRRIERMASLGTLLGGVAHELNNPLTSIKSFAQLMMLDDRQGEDREAIEIIHRESDRAAKIVADLRVIARQAQEEDLQRAAVDLNEVVRHVLKLRRYAMESQNIELREDLAHDLFPVWADRGKLEQVVLNLVVNAEQAVRSATGTRRLIIRTRPSRRAVLLAVIDSGSGIPAEHLDRVFDPFWTTKEPGEGMGLGLSLVHSIVTEHNGEIRVESEVGKGAAFTVMLPWSTHVTPPVQVEALPRRNDGLRVLLVEDEAPIRLSVTRFLERRGHRVDQAAEAAEALRLLNEDAHYDLIVSDLRMPGLGGDELFTRLRARGDGMERRMIFVTGDAASEETEHFLAEAGVPVLLKPFALTEIAELIERQVSRLRDTPSAEGGMT